MATQSTITAENIQGVTYYQTESKGIAYTCYFTKQGEWCVHSQRLALGRHNTGSYRYYKNIESLASNIKAFKQLPQLLAAPAGSVLH